MKKFLLISTLCFVSFAAHADERTAIPYMGGDMGIGGQNCRMIETNTLVVNFNNIPVTVSKAKAFMDERVAEIETLAKQAGLQKFELNSLNYSVYGNSTGGGCGEMVAPVQYILSGSVGYTLDDVTKAESLIKQIEAKGYQINLNSNAYKQCQ